MLWKIKMFWRRFKEKMQWSSEELYIFYLRKKFQLPNIPKNKINNSGILCWPHMTIHSSVSSIILHVQMDPYLTKNILCVQLSGRVVRYTSDNTTPSPGEASSVSITISASFEVQKRVFSFLRSLMVFRSAVVKLKENI